MDKAVKFPQPYPDQFSYALNKYIALASSPRRLCNYLLSKYAKRSRTPRHLPVRADIENVSRCNLKCQMCQVGTWEKQRRAPDLSLEAFKKFVDSQYGLIELKIQGMGEPLLQGDPFFEMIRYARAKKIWVRSTTNATILHLHDNYKKLVDAGPNDLQISIDGASKEAYESIRIGAKFEQVVENCRKLNAYCREVGSRLKPQMWVVVQKANFDELEDFVPLAHKMLFPRLSFNLALSAWGQEHCERYNDTIQFPPLSQERVDKIVEDAKQYGIQIGFWDQARRYSTRSAESLCPWPFERTYVGSDLKAAPCCVIANPDVVNLGDASDFALAWQGAAYQEFRSAHLEGRIPKQCLSCYGLRNC